ncbi:MAG: PQQ-binding-like beta-propeller repeat protein [Candidatus Bathyarchaeota archaeon]|nr:PQQ-binding-like beta-propeller repeat protein [Candidatus Bathyarchaeota archaeon]
MKRNSARSLTALLTAVLMITLLLTLNPAVSTSADSWSMYRGNQQRSGASSGTAPSVGDIKWVYNASAEVDSSPSVANGRVVAGLASGDVVALNATTGALLWTYASESGQSAIWSSPAIDGGRVYVGNRQGNLLCLNETTGELLWSFSAGGEVDSSPAVENGKVYFNVCVPSQSGSTVKDAKFYCLDVNGSVLWKYQCSGGQDFSSPAILDNTVFECTLNDVVALNADSGALRWSTHVFSDGSITSTPTVSSGKVFVCSNLAVSCLNVDTGSILWTQTSFDSQSIGAFRSSPAVIGNSLIVCSSFGTVFNLNTQTGSLNWKFKVTTSEVWSSPAVAEGKVLVGAGDGKLYCINLTDGSLLWSKYTLDRIVSSPAVCDGVVYVGCGTAGAGRIYAFGAKYTKLSTLTLTLNSQAAFLGFKVKLSGSLNSPTGPIANVPVTLSFSVNCGETWNDITAVPTGADGAYEAVWVPSATGTYLVKASWNGAYPTSASQDIRALSVTLYQDQYVFSVVSNSTVSALSFNSEKEELSFSVTGESGTSGTTQVYIAKDLLPSLAELTVLLDQSDLQYRADSVGDAWLLSFSYTHSSHNVVVAFQGAHIDLPTQTPFVIGNFAFTSETLLWIIIILLATVVFLAVFIAANSMREKHTKNKPS